MVPIAAVLYPLPGWAELVGRLQSACRRAGAMEKAHLLGAYHLSVPEQVMCSSAGSPGGKGFWYVLWELQKLSQEMSDVTHQLDCVSVPSGCSNRTPNWGGGVLRTQQRPSHRPPGHTPQVKLSAGLVPWRRTLPASPCFWGSRVFLGHRHLSSPSLCLHGASCSECPVLSLIRTLSLGLGHTPSHDELLFVLPLITPAKTLFPNKATF